MTTTHHVNRSGHPTFNHAGQLVGHGAFIGNAPAPAQPEPTPQAPATFAIAAQDPSVSALATFKAAFVSPYHLAGYLQAFQGPDDFLAATGLEPTDVQKLLGDWFDADREARQVITDPAPEAGDPVEVEYLGEPTRLNPTVARAFREEAQFQAAEAAGLVPKGFERHAAGGIVPGSEPGGLPVMAQSSDFPLSRDLADSLSEGLPPAGDVNLTIEVGGLPLIEGGAGNPAAADPPVIPPADQAGTAPAPAAQAAAPAASSPPAQPAKAAKVPTEGAKATEKPAGKRQGARKGSDAE